MRREYNLRASVILTETFNPGRHYQGMCSNTVCLHLKNGYWQVFDYKGGVTPEYLDFMEAAHYAISLMEDPAMAMKLTAVIEEVKKITHEDHVRI